MYIYKIILKGSDWFNEIGVNNNIFTNKFDIGNYSSREGQLKK